MVPPGVTTILRNSSGDSAGFTGELGRAEHGLRGEPKRGRGRQLALLRTLRQGLNYAVDEGRAAPGQRGYGIDVLFFNLHDDPHRGENLFRRGQIFHRRANTWSDRTRPAADAADGVFVITRMNLAGATPSMLSSRMPAASEIRACPSACCGCLAYTGRTTAGFTPRELRQRSCATSRLFAVTAMPFSISIVLRSSSFGSRAMISGGVQNLARSRPRMTEPASLPAPIKPRR